MKIDYKSLPQNNILKLILIITAIGFAEFIFEHLNILQDIRFKNTIARTFSLVELIIGLIIFYLLAKKWKSATRALPILTPHTSFMIIFSFVFIIGCCLIISHFYYGSYQVVLRNVFKVPTGKIPFGDMRITLLGIEMYSNGKDPLLDKSYINGNLWCYPRAWYLFSYLGLKQSMTPIISMFIIAIFYFWTFIFFRRSTWFICVYYGLILCSPPILLSLERANVDVLIFIVILTMVFVNKKRHSKLIVASLILICAFLKLFPIFSVLIFLKEKKRASMIYSAFIIVCFLCYLFIELISIRAIHLQMGRPLDITSFGLHQLPDFISKYIFPSLNPAILFLVGIGVVISATLLILKSKDYVNFLEVASPNLDAFRMGSSIYLGLYIFGYNFSYNLVFLLLCLPQIIDWSHLNNSMGKYSGFALLIILFIYTHLLFIDTLVINGLSFLLKEFEFWILTLYLIYALMLSFPIWLKEFTSKYISHRLR